MEAESPASVPKNYSTLADTVACIMTETTEVPIPDALTPNWTTS